MSLSKNIAFALFVAVFCGVVQAKTTSGKKEVSSPMMLMPGECPCMLVSTEEEASMGCPEACQVAPTTSKNGKYKGYMCCQMDAESEKQVTVRADNIPGEQNANELQVLNNAASRKPGAPCPTLFRTCIIRRCYLFSSGRVFCRFFLALCRVIIRC